MVSIDLQETIARAKNIVYKIVLMVIGFDGL